MIFKQGDQVPCGGQAGAIDQHIEIPIVVVLIGLHAVVEGFEVRHISGNDNYAFNIVLESSYVDYLSHENDLKNRFI